MITRRRIVAALLSTASAAIAVIAAVPPGPGRVAGAGIVTELNDKERWVMIWTDGEESPVKYLLADTFDMKTFGFPPERKGVFSPDRVKFTYTIAGDVRTVLVMDKEPQLARGTVTGTVMFSNDFWVAVKPRNGPLDGFAMGRSPGWQALGERLKALQRGDTVTITFYTDVERHRIVTMTVVPRRPGEEIPSLAPRVPATQPRSVAPAASGSPTTSQPAQDLETQARAKLRLAELYVDSGQKDQARELLQIIIKVFPTTEAAKEAEVRLKALVGGE